MEADYGTVWMVLYRNRTFGAAGGTADSGQRQAQDFILLHTKKFAQEFAAQAYECPEDAICAPGVQGVYIVTTHNVHFRFAKLALELGKPVLCEKAFAVTATEADVLIALAREKQLYLAEAMWTWFSPAAYQTKQCYG